MTQKIVKTRSISVDLLKALAVIAVFLYHCEPKIFKSGFLGVEFFLLVTGYLSSKSLRKKKLEEFIKDRFYRVMPSLLAHLALFTCILSLIAVPKEIYENLKLSIASILLNANNYLLITGNNYFSDSGSYIFLHNWSISLEFQIWILLAVIRLISKSLKLRKIIYILFFIILQLYSFYLIYNDNFITEYFNPFRSMGLAFLGYVLGQQDSLFTIRLPKGSISFIIIIAITFTGMNFSFITYLCLISVSIIIIAANLSANTKEVGIITWLSNHTYGIYLYHFPLIIIIRDYYAIDSFVLPALLLTLLMAYLSRKYLENV